MSTRSIKRSEGVVAVIAAKDEQAHIAQVVEETKRYVERVVVVDDGSDDATAQTARKAGADVLVHVVNLGKGAAIRTGIEQSIEDGAKTLILLDADGQHEPRMIPRFLDALEDADIVFGTRQGRRKMPFVLKFGNWFLSKATKLVYGLDIPDTQCGYRAFHAGIYPKIKWESSGYSMESEMIANVGRERLKYAFIPISTIYQSRYKGTTVIDGLKIGVNLIWWRVRRKRP